MISPEIVDAAESRPTAASRRRLSRRASFWLAGAVLVCFLTASTVPSPMYALYQREWGFSSTVLTVVFAAYMAGILFTLLTLGSLSDHIGRRPVLLAALVVEILAVVVLAASPGVGWLIAGRVLQGAATGAVTSTVSATLLDFQPRGTNRGATVNTVTTAAGMALGSALGGVLVQFAPSPTVLPYVLLAVVFVLLFAGVLVMPESARAESTRGAGALVLRPQRPTVPAGHGRAFALLATTMVAAWIVGGMYMSLGPSVAKSLVSGDEYLVGGLALALMVGGGALAQLTLAGRSGRFAVRFAAPLIVLGLAGVAVAVLTGSASVFFLSSLVLGVGWGPMFLGGFRMLSGLATPEHRAGTSATIYLVGYLSSSVPTILLGLVTTAFGLVTAVLVFVVAAAAFAVIAGLTALRHGA